MGKPYFTWLRAARAYGADYEATDSFFWGDDGTAIPEPRVANDPSLEAGVVTPASVGSGDWQGRKYRFVASDVQYCRGGAKVIDGNAHKFETIEECWQKCDETPGCGCVHYCEGPGRTAEGSGGRSGECWGYAKTWSGTKAGCGATSDWKVAFWEEWPDSCSLLEEPSRFPSSSREDCRGEGVGPVRGGSVLRVGRSASV